MVGLPYEIEPHRYRAWRNTAAYYLDLYFEYKISCRRAIRLWRYFLLKISPYLCYDVVFVPNGGWILVSSFSFIDINSFLLGVLPSQMVVV
jgi:hypothetical protein